MNKDQKKDPPTNGSEEKGIMKVDDHDLLTRFGVRELFLTRDREGFVRTTCGEYELDLEKQEVLLIQGTPMIPKNIAFRLNKIASASLVDAPFILLNDRKEANPVIERDENKVPQSIRHCRLAIGFSPIGNRVVLMKTYYFNLHTYFLKRLKSKVKNYPACGKFGRQEACPAEKKYRTWIKSQKKYSEEKTASFDPENMEFYSIKGKLGYWIDVSHPEIQALFDDLLEKTDNCEQYVQSVLDRNLLTDFMGIKHLTIQNGKARVRIFGYRRVMEHDEIQELARKAAEGNLSPDDAVFKQETVDVTVEEITTVEDDVEADAAIEQSESDTSEAAPEPGSPPPPMEGGTGNKTPGKDDRPEADKLPAAAGETGSITKTPAPASPLSNDLSQPGEPSKAGMTDTPLLSAPSNINDELIKAREIVGKDTYKKILAETFKTNSALKLNPEDKDLFLTMLHRAAEK